MSRHTRTYVSYSRIFGLNLTSPVDNHPCTSASAHTGGPHDRPSNHRSAPRNPASYQRQAGGQRLPSFSTRNRIRSGPRIPFHRQTPPRRTRGAGLPRTRTRPTARPRPNRQGAQRARHPGARPLPRRPHRNPRLPRSGRGHGNPARRSHRGGFTHHCRTARRGRVPPTHLHDRARRPLHARSQRTVHDRRRHLRR